MAILRILTRFTFGAGIRQISTQPQFGLLFDIDGVIVRGQKVLPSVRDGFARLVDKNGKFRVPTVFVTNSGNALRSERAQDLSKWLDLKVHEEQVILAHTPLQMFKLFHDKHILITGQGRVKEIAKELGFKNIITMDELVECFPSLDYIDKEHRNPQSGPLDPNFKKIDAIVLLSEPTKWETHLQLIIDLLITHGFPVNNPLQYVYPHIPVIACNMDLLWVSEAPIPRYGHGALLTCLEALYKKVTGLKLYYTALIGKPSIVTYHFATQKLIEHAKSIGVSSDIIRLYAVGDNVNTDIYGANLYNKHLNGHVDFKESSIAANKIIKENQKHVCTLKECLSMLVETGVYQPDSSFNVHHSARDFLPVRENLCEPKYISKDVGTAIDIAFKAENYN